ncbi:SDR family oxidoreductase [Roseovarius salis]|uniref:SDR family oxidoreductase n=1 Tax=Roseovarius salis TaxID=3376063 RepID=UPI0037CB3BA1
MSTEPVLILGGRSDIGLALARAYAAKGHAIQLAARDAATLETEKNDIALRHGVDVTLHDFDVLDYDSHESFVDGLPVLPGNAISVVGYMGEQDENERDMAAARLVMRSNFEGPANILAILANRFEERGSGTLIGISSVAGERGRATNYVYGSAKAGFTAFLSGLRNRLTGSGVHVMTVLPGFVATRMTEGMDLPDKLTADPAALARRVQHAAGRRRNVIYVKRVWWLVMLIIRNIPEPVFKKLRL